MYLKRRIPGCALKKSLGSGGGGSKSGRGQVPERDMSDSVGDRLRVFIIVYLD